MRVQLPQFAGIQSAHELTDMINSGITIECEAPNNNIYTFEGVLTMKATTPTPKSALSTPKQSPRGSPKMKREDSAHITREDSTHMYRENSSAVLLPPSATPSYVIA